QRQVILLRITQPGLVNIIQTAEQPPLQPGQQPSQRPAEPAVDEADAVKQVTLADGGRENQFPQGGGGETLVIAGQQTVQKSGAAARNAHHEQRLAHGDLAITGKQHPIQQQGQAVDRLQQQKGG